MHDAIVIGARCAGAATALLLARAGHDVLLVDRAHLPKDLPNGHFIHRGGPARLHAWRLLDRVVATGAPLVTTMTTDFGDGPLRATGVERDGIPLGIAPRRRVLDRVLAEAAVEAGAELRTGFAVTDLVTDGDRVTGVRRRGDATPERARVVVGADGRGSWFARAVDAPVTHAAPDLTCWYFGYWSGVACDGLEMHVLGDRVLFAFPTNDDLAGVFIGWPLAELAAVRADIDAAFAAVLARVPGLEARVRAGTREERYGGATRLPNVLRRPHGPGWALVGDAGAHKDPFMALGIADALRDAELLAGALDDGLSGRAPLDEALAGYGRARDAATLPDFHANVAAARFEPPPPEHTRLRAALRHAAPEDVRAFHLATQGLAPPESFFNDATLGRLMAAA